MFDKLGSQVVWDHLWAKTHDPDTIIGKGISRTLIDGVPWLTTKLRKGLKLAQSVYQFYLDGMKLGYSIQGTGVRDPKDPTNVKRMAITMITIAPQPKGFDQFMVAGPVPVNYGLDSIAKAIMSGDEVTPIGRWQPVEYEKALTTGAGIVEGGAQGGQALREQYLANDVQSESFGEKPKRRKKKSLRQKLADALRGRVNVEKSASVEKSTTKETSMKRIDERDSKRKGGDEDEQDPDDDYSDMDDDQDPDDSDPEDDDEGNGSIEKAIDNLSTLDDVRDVISEEISKSVEPLYELISALRGELEDARTLLAKSYDASKVINENIVELGEFSESLQKAVEAQNEHLEKAVFSNYSTNDLEARTTPAPKQRAVDTVINKSVTTAIDAVDATTIAKLCKAAEDKQQNGTYIPAYGKLVDAINLRSQGNEIDLAPFATALEKALGE